METPSGRTGYTTTRNSSVWYRKPFRFWMQMNERKPIKSCSCAYGMKVIN
jgi:hypothetical protein